MPLRMHFRPVFPSRRADKIRERAQDLWSQQREQAAKRDTASSKRRRSEFSCIRGRSPAQGPGLRVRGGDLGSSEASTSAAEGVGRHKRRFDALHHQRHPPLRPQSSEERREEDGLWVRSRVIRPESALLSSLFLW